MFTKLIENISGTLMLEFFQNKEPYNEVFRRPDVNFATNKVYFK